MTVTCSESLRLAIKLKRERSKISLAELARRSEVSVSQLSSFLSGKRSLTLDSVDRLARYLGWPPKPEKNPAPEYIMVSLSPERFIVARRSAPCHDVPGWEYNSLSGRKRLKWLGANEELDRLYGVETRKN
jgi:transcriptional regulator with XRE-family HTH domain